MTTAEELAAQAAAAIAERTGLERHDIAVVLGSGWGGAADSFPVTADIPYEQLPGFAASAVTGHSGSLRSCAVGDKNVLFFAGRTHYYEGRGVDAVVHGVRTAAAAGCTVLVLTNGCGGLNPDWPPGTPVIIRDHINLTATTPLVGANFVDMTQTYSRRLRDIARTVDPDLDEGVYAQFPGPQYETPAEVRMAGILGADLVGMSTVLEAIAARAAGLEILGLSLVTNAAAGLSGEALHHAEVLQAGKDAATRLSDLLSRILEQA
ncbi:MAG: purine-nucleoside phosphorylase [Actinobacteria bacterium]|nr:purine-nucleoside phosphorylase [Actinomycetota bacterium]MCB8996339.1 purine-nucleoside phosphorylase [Actinomycetota bacterium]MCB9414859.1 purine-nucleoside phosphorylase [Actinomycetota bacterium]HRY09751.1 purine-nucleoside phosphorylase [Candidatus Nanopelagicales bacterium]